MPTECSRNSVPRGRLIVAALLSWLISTVAAHAEQPMPLDQVVAEACQVNPLVRGARARWESARHQIIQKYTPADPQFTFNALDSWRGFLADSGTHNLNLTESLQFPGKALLQGRSARRTAEIAHLTYLGGTARCHGSGQGSVLSDSARHGAECAAR